MLNLFYKMDLTQVVIFIFLIMLAGKEFFSLCDFFYIKIRKIFDKEYKRKTEQELLKDGIERQNLETEKTEKQISKLSIQFSDFQDTCEKNFKRQDEQLNRLTNSDRDNIRGWIVKEYHFFTEQKGWIDDFSMDSIEKCFANYVEEGGNSYVHGLLRELRKLPKCPPEEKK